MRSEGRSGLLGKRFFWPRTPNEVIEGVPGASATVRLIAFWDFVGSLLEYFRDERAIKNRDLFQGSLEGAKVSDFSKILRRNLIGKGMILCR